MANNNSTASVFNIFVTGQIESASFPLGPNASEIFCRYEMVAGPDWELVSGIKSGITQSAVAKGGGMNEIVFNMPIELTYSSTNPFGWPQMIISVYGRNHWGVEISLGYGRTHIPVLGQQSGHRSRVPILTPKSTTMLSEVWNWMTNKNPELKNPKILADGTNISGLNMESYGVVNLQLNCISRGTSRLGYVWGRSAE